MTSVSSPDFTSKLGVLMCPWNRKTHEKKGHPGNVAMYMSSIWKEALKSHPKDWTEHISSAVKSRLLLLDCRESEEEIPAAWIGLK